MKSRRLGTSAGRQASAPAPTNSSRPGIAEARRLALPAALVGGLAVAVYGSVGGFEFVNYDDYHYVVENTHVATGLIWSNAAWALEAFWAGNWHPLTWISHQLDASLYGLAPGGHHVTNLVLHAANGVGLLLVLHSLTGALWRSAVVAALFAVHPLNVESVAWVSERKNVLSTLFWLLAMGAWGGYVRRPSRGRYVLVALWLALGLMAKPMVVTLPCVLLLLDWWPLRRFDPDAPGARVSALALVKEKLPLFGLVAVSSLLTLGAQKGAGAVTSLEQVPLAARLSNAAVSYVVYLWQTFWPAGLSAFYPHPGRTPKLGAALAAVAGIALLTGLAWRVRRPAPYAPVGWLWYLGTLVPVIGLVQVGSQAHADRYAYVPLIGVFVAIAWGLPALVPAPRLLGALAAAGVAALAVAAQRQALHWRDSIALFEHAKQVTRRNYVAYTNLGLAYNKQKKWDTAIQNFQAALRIEPESAEALGHMGLALAKKGDVDGAIDALRKAIAIYPKSEHAHNNLGVALRKRDARQAVDHLRQAVALAPEFAEARVNLAAALFSAGEPEEAARALEEAIRLEPGVAATRTRVGAVWLERGDHPAAIREFEEALRLDPLHGDARNSRGVARLRQGDLAGARADFEEVLRRQPADADAHSNLGTVLVRQGKPAEGTAELETAIALNPRQADAHATLGAVLAQAGKLDAAIPHFRSAVEADPTNAVALNNLGAALLQQGDAAAAVERLQAAVSANPRLADAHSNLGVALLQQGRVAEAVRHLERALEISPAQENARRHLALARGRPGSSRTGRGS
jgi:tetratricopeptide (TPR) repeat protein